jgi:transposase
MVRIPTIAEEDAKRPNRERECLVRERTRLVNRMKGALARLGIRNFRPTLRKAVARYAGLTGAPDVSCASIPTPGNSRPFLLPDHYASVRQLAGRKGEVWGAESGADKLFVLKAE